MKQNKYQDESKAIELKLTKLETESKKLSSIRMLDFLFVLFFLYVGMEYHYLGYIGAAIGLLVFLWLVKKHDVIKYDIQYAKTRLEVLQRYMERMQNGWKNFIENGEVYLDEKYPPGYDLDIFGKASLYQYINVAFSEDGKKQLANWLTAMPKRAEVINKRQAAVSECVDKVDFGIHLETLGCLANKTMKSNKIFDAFQELTTTAGNNNSIMKYLKWILPAILMGAILCFILFSNVLFMVVIEVVFVLQLILTFAFHGKNNPILQPVFALQESLSIYEKIFATLENEMFEDPYLLSLQQTWNGEKGATKGIKELSKVSDLLKMRKNILAYILVSGLFLWDFHCVEKVAGWHMRYASQLPTWFSSLAEIEAILSLSTIAKVKDEYCFPEVIDGSCELDMKAVSHPLINEQDAIDNDFKVFHESCVITGSNMSGKTTFLRTIGLNAVLAYAGAPVVANSYKISLMQLFTSMRIEDDVSEGISTFYAELLRIKEIIEFNHTGKPMLALIDEIFKGTNSKDRILGATETIRQLSNDHSITCVTTHDFELCDLENDQDIHSKNYHFSETYKDEKIFFDYKIKKGMATTTNAKYLLEMVGIIKK
ncbi:DNA mismatch repair ATPase MutS [Breznakia sp. PF5-3]|uniref:MutS family DNA mismatch repair protein n=1 Tax=unclassified Breznakia TaxID=2623764 RepID=UPI0024050704|nr:MULTISPECIES: MutS family DNA mismatch repair protein [unclassified Breznakia]MDF9825778.1 DNA mismatch repair ATPase MutS [Breznakia sp. PM6-1]MDF9836583.1 DNA mismatch repair ATPase MutS [Breznakia sp. PF5-3]MDF9838811.1 DNA mismatch repair ATPase MutS [Breznakia sp. PFB2-8]MDF9860837.1 DNA mismatch repair ATPase MutS [Breznakia sp. PH5-24]